MGTVSQLTFQRYKLEIIYKSCIDNDVNKTINQSQLFYAFQTNFPLKQHITASAVLYLGRVLNTTRFTVFSIILSPPTNMESKQMVVQRPK